MKTRYAITHVNGKTKLRQLTCANQGRNHFDSEVEANKWLKASLQLTNGGLVNVLTPEELATVQVSSVQCHDHGDAVGMYVDN